MVLRWSVGFLHYLFAPSLYSDFAVDPCMGLMGDLLASRIIEPSSFVSRVDAMHAALMVNLSAHTPEFVGLTYDQYTLIWHRHFGGVCVKAFTVFYCGSPHSEYVQLFVNGVSAWVEGTGGMFAPLAHGPDLCNYIFKGTLPIWLFGQGDPLFYGQGLSAHGQFQGSLLSDIINPVKNFSFIQSGYLPERRWLESLIDAEYPGWVEPDLADSYEYWLTQSYTELITLQQPYPTYYDLLTAIREQTNTTLPNEFAAHVQGHLDNGGTASYSAENEVLGYLKTLYNSK